MLTSDEIGKIAFLLYPHITGGPLDSASIDALAARVKDVHRGLSPEDEFAATVCWLGNCAGIHRIDQTPMPVPEIAERMRAPDFIAFPMVNGAPFPVLIEVKSSKHTQMKWSAKYRRSLITFAEHVKLPLLVAWKTHNFWFLVDHRHLQKKHTGYRLDLDTAFREDLSCALFRNLRIQMNPDLRFVLHMDILDEMPGDADAPLPEGTLSFQIRRAAFYAGELQLEDQKPSFAFSLLMATPDDVELKRTGRQTCDHIFRPLENHGFSLSNVFVAQLSLRHHGDEVDWHRVLTRPLPSSGLQLRDSLDTAIKNKFIRYVMDILPNTWPDFLPEHPKVPRPVIAN